ncbi:hypothetical protein [Nonomuraea dietziae]|uniref:Uncharacterized protein n=1 Tax=Nonomuraea dietziae TaxID=65515 RepID=A0A7W5VLV8_9ACTN|nr:hypothetical protein [Nonomuraea dietziae]MBB3733795.1 hypothetical protein [Nonomuraea dietziae]
MSENTNVGIGLNAPGLGVQVDEAHTAQYLDMARKGMIVADSSNCGAVQNNFALTAETTTRL